LSGTIKANLSWALATTLALTVALMSLPIMMATPAEAVLSAEDGKKIVFTSDRTTGPGSTTPKGTTRSSRRTATARASNS
jgi:hypothetical protein